jgi:protein-disulfide isomerase
VSRGYDARRKAKRQRARAAAESPQRQSQTDSGRLVVLLPLLAIAAVLVATAVVAFGAGGSPSRKRIDQEVTALLAGIPQHGPALGSSSAPVTLQIFIDLECPTVRSFVESYLPSIIRTWVRTGDVGLEYRPLKTDTIDEHFFFRQEEATLAAGEQNRLWNFALTFVHQQGAHFTDYATDAFLVHMASQVPELEMPRWNRDRKDISLFKPIALSVYAAHRRGLASTPSFLISGPATSSVKDELESSLERAIGALSLETSGDVPILRAS